MPPRRDKVRSRPQETTDPGDLDARLAKIEEQMSTLLKVFLDGVPAGEDAPGRPATRKLTIREQRARDARDVAAQVNEALPNPEMAQILRKYREPRRQKKLRELKPRKLYRLKTINTPDMLMSLRSLTPAATSIIVYLASHPDATVPDISTQLDLRRKTVENLLSTLKIKGLIQTKDV